MSLSSVSIERPVLTTVMMLVILVFGIIGVTQLGVREYPQSERPMVTVRASYPGANASVIENQITKPLEEEINTVEGIVSMTSTSREGMGQVRVEFELGDDIERAANDVRDRVSAAARRLPIDVQPPVITKADADGEPVVGLSIESSRRNGMELTQIADELVKARMETIPGVGRVDIWGAKTFAMRLWIDSDRLAAYGLSPLDVRRAFEQANVELPSGKIEGANMDLSVRTDSRLRDDPKELGQLIIKRNGESVVRFSDIGRAELAPLNDRSGLKRDGVPMVTVVLRPQSNANQIEIVDEFYRRLEELKHDLPDDISVGVDFDSSVFVRNSIEEVGQTIIFALILVALTMFLFLREVRSSVIPLVAIPVSLVGGFFILWISGFSLNVLTLLAMVLGVGLVVDDAVIVLENSYTKIEQGLEPKQAALDGIREIYIAVIATTIALVAVFMPMVFIGGLTGVLFREFGIALAGVVVISAFVALTLTPMMCSRWLRKKNPGWFYNVTEPFFVAMNRAYRNSLAIFMRAKWLVIPIFIGCFALIGWFWSVLPVELAPREDRGLVIGQVRGPQGANFEYMTQVMDEVDTVILDGFGDQTAALVSMTSPGFGGSATSNSGFFRMALKPVQDRTMGAEQIVAQLMGQLQNVAGAEIFVHQPPTFSGGGRGRPVQFIVQNQDFNKLEAILPVFLEQAKARAELSGVEVDLVFNNPELQVQVDRNRTESLGVAVGDVAGALQATLSGQRYGYFLREGRQYEMVGQLERGSRSAPMDLTRIQTRGHNGALIGLDNLATFQEGSAPPILYRYNRFSSATFSSNLGQGYALGDGIRAMREVAKGVLDETFATELAGEARELERTGQSLAYVFALSLLLVYLALSAQFESFRSPAIIMTTVPLALLGGLLALWWTGQTLNIFSQIGLIMLIGLVTKNGILLVEFANQRRAAGLGVQEASIDAAASRFRPILMTALSTILGTLPIALALGAGARSRVPLGVAVVGGLLLGTFLTLYVVPVVYCWFAPKQVVSNA